MKTPNAGCRNDWDFFLSTVLWDCMDGDYFVLFVEPLSKFIDGSVGRSIGAVTILFYEDCAR